MGGGDLALVVSYRKSGIDDEERLNALVRGYSTTTNNPAVRFHSTQSKIKNLPSDYRSASKGGIQRGERGRTYHYQNKHQSIPLSLIPS